ncbi:MAG: hypothetical protein ACI3ZL_03145 [Candidatus Cryptobacteroides sp.]
MRLRDYVKASLMMLLCIVMSSCGIVEIGGSQGQDNGVWKPHGSGETGENDKPVGHSILYMTTMEYPKGYDWMSDPEKGTVKCSLVVSADGAPTLKLAVGDNYCISSDPDMHRLIDGSIYTDFSTESETVIKRDGVECFRYGARESILGMNVVGDDIYTLGQSRSGAGFSFRKNGETIVAKKYGYLFRHLDCGEDGEMSFAFYEAVSSGDEMLERYYLVRDSEVTQVALREDIKKVWDVVLHKGEPCYVASVKGFAGLMLVEGEKLSALTIPDGSEVLSCRMFVCDEELCVEAVVNYSGNTYSTIWKEGKRLCGFSARMTISAIYSGDGGVNCVLNPLSRYDAGMIYRNGEVYEMPEGYYSMCGTTATSFNGLLYVGLTSSSGESPVLWKEGQEEKVSMNGFISSLTSVIVVP